MSKKAPKKDTDSKIKFFKIDPEGDIAPAFPDKPGPDDLSESSLPRIEPVFGAGEEESLPLMQSPQEQTGSIAPFQPETDHPQREEQMHLLKPQVDDIARMQGGEALTEDQADVLKKYISLKEFEVRDLRDQRKQYEAFVKKVSAQVESVSRRNHELLTELEALKRREEALRADHREAKERHQNEVLLVKNDYEERLRMSGNYDAQAAELSKEREQWREKVKEDLKRIKLKERELENKYELLKRDTQALLDSKDKHQLDLKRKNDALELELESLEDRLRKNNSVLGSIDSKKRRLIETMKLAISLLEDIDQADLVSDDDSKPRKAG